MSFVSRLQRTCLVGVDIRSAHNVGSLFRTCDGFGAQLLLVGITPRPQYVHDSRLPHIARQAEKQIAKTALGAEESVEWCYAENYVTCIKMLREQGYFIAALEQDEKSKNLRDLIIKDKPVALLVGREVEGMSKEELELCDAIYEIPMRGKKESFNVSVAAGIGMYQLACNS